MRHVGEVRPLRWRDHSRKRRRRSSSPPTAPKMAAPPPPEPPPVSALPGAESGRNGGGAAGGARREGSAANSAGESEPLESASRRVKNAAQLEAVGEAVAAVAPTAQEAVGEADELVEPAEETITMLMNTFETCKTVYEKPTKEQDEWYYYCGKVIDQISQTEEFQTSREDLYELVIANLLEHLSFDESITLLNYLYEKNNR